MKHIGPTDTVNGNFNMSEMLHEAAKRANMTVKNGWNTTKRADAPKGQPGSYKPFHGIYLPKATPAGFFCGVVHVTPDVIVFNPEGDNLNNFKFNNTKANVLQGQNYHIIKSIAGIPKNVESVFIQVDLHKDLFGRNSFYSLKCANCQCEWLSMFISKAYTDMMAF